MFCRACATDTGAMAGEACRVIDLRSRQRDGDRFWFEAPDAGFSDSEIAEFKMPTTARAQ